MFTETALQESISLDSVAQLALQEAKKMGATQSAVSVSLSCGFSIVVRLGEVESVEHHRDQGVGITLYHGKRQGMSSSSALDPASIRQAIEKSYTIATYTQEDPCHGLPAPEELATTFHELDLYHPHAITPTEAIERAKACEAAARAFDKRIINSEGVEINATQSISLYATSDGFVGRTQKSSYHQNCSLIAESAGQMEREGSFGCARDFRDLPDTVSLGLQAAERTINRLGARKIKSCKTPVIFEAPIASQLLANFIQAISGHALYKKASFLLDQLHQPIFPAWVRIDERPHLKKGLRSASFDHEGVTTRAKDFINNGILQTYHLDNYSARRLQLKTTGNAGGVRNLFISIGQHDLPALLKQMGRGLLVTELLGDGVNLVTGDYSHGASGFWIDHGIIQYPVSEITISSNLQSIYRHLIDVGHDVYPHHAIQTGSLLIEEMTIGGD